MCRQSESNSGSDTASAEKKTANASLISLTNVGRLPCKQADWSYSTLPGIATFALALDHSLEYPARKPLDPYMIKRLFVQIVESISSTDTGDAHDREAALRLATAVLMIDVARADHVFEESEFDRVLQLVEKHFELTPEQAAQLVNEASDRAEDLVSAYEFTEVLHKHLSDDEILFLRDWRSAGP